MPALAYLITPQIFLFQNMPQDIQFGITNAAMNSIHQIYESLQIYLKKKYKEECFLDF